MNRIFFYFFAILMLLNKVSKADSIYAENIIGSKNDVFRVVAFYSGNWDVAHISFVREANEWLPKIAAEYNFIYEMTTDWNNLNREFLNGYDVVLFLDNIPSETAHRLAFEEFMENGGAFIAFHAAAYNDNPQKWDWYFNHFLGVGKFAGNTWKPTAAYLKVESRTHPVTSGLPDVFKSQPNEWYKWEKDLRDNENMEILLSIDVSSFPLGTGPKLHEIWHSGYYPVVWANKNYHMLYINMGHNDMLYNPDRTISYTFENDVQNNVFINSLLWLGREKRKK